MESNTLDVHFNKALIDSCKDDIAKHCSDVFGEKDEANDESDDEDTEQNNANTDANPVQDRDMGGRVIACLRSKYANTNIQLETQCRTELVDVIQASKLDIQLDVRLYQECKSILRSQCVGADKEDCLKILYQQKKISEKKCREQVLRIIREGKADIHVDPSLLATCQADVLKLCNDIPMGSGKQLQCLLKNKRALVKPCKELLSKRQELWQAISDVDDIDDLTRHIIYSQNKRYLYTVIFAGVLVIFLAGCVCRPWVRYRRVTKYN